MVWQMVMLWWLVICTKKGIDDDDDDDQIGRHCCLCEHVVFAPHIAKIYDS
jgi:hypothetical protein